MSGIDQDDLVDGRYRIQSRLGTGGMADVFLAQDQQLERQVALKLLHRRFSEDPGFVERFRREAQSAANLQHPNVVAVYDRGSWDGTYYIAMEYLQGRTLKQVIRDEAPLDPVRAIDITVQILKATRFAHRRGVIHRDLKPHNVMLDDQDHAKVTDFGIARAGASDMTETGSIMGTAQYLSPEQAQGLAVEAPSDLYSIAIILYELLTGHVPFDAESAVTIALKHVSEAPTPPSRYNPEIPPALEQTVLWALNKNPADRPQDADQFINVLEGIRESLVAGGSGQVTASMAALSAGAAAAALGGAAAAGAGPHPRVQLGDQPLGAYGPAVAPAPGESGALPSVGAAGGGFGSEQPRRRSRWSRIWPWLLGLVVLAAIAAAVVVFVVVKNDKNTVPLVVGKSQSQATTLLNNAGFTPSVIEAQSSQPLGDVTAQSPLGGTKTKQKFVYITVSEGQGNTEVPPVAQESRTAAIDTLREAGINVSRVLTESSSTVPAKEATRTDPEAGQSVPKGSDVVLYISTGAAPTSVPNVVGDTASTATSTLEGAHFKVNVTQQASSTVTAGNVISQTPQGNSTATPGSEVTLVVATAEPTATVPNVVGDSEGSALSALTGAGFTYKRTYELTDAQSQNRVVLAQSPSGNTTSPKNTVITVVIGKYSASATTSGTTTTPTGTSTTAGNSGSGSTTSTTS